MKRVLSLILVLVLALGSVPFAFAEEAATMTAGETLKGYGLAKGVDAEGNLNEEGMLTRAEMMVMISRLLGVEEEAMNYAIPSTSKDVANHWAAKYIAYAEQVGKWTAGVGNDMFAPQAQVTNQMVAKFMMTALGYEANWDTAVVDATALGLMTGVDGEATAFITRGDVFKASLNTINQPKKDSDVKLGVTLGVLEPEVNPVVALEGAVIDTVKATGNALVTITFDEAVDMAGAAAATYVIVEKADAAKMITVNKVNVESATVVTLETDAMTAGTAYKVSFADLSSFFTGIAKDLDVPKVSSVKGTDTNLFEVKFDMNLDKSTAEDIANYSINTVGTVVKAALNSDRQTVTLTTEGFVKVAAHKLTVENVLSVDAKMIAKTTKTFYPVFDKSAPTIETIKNINTANNVEIYVFFDDAHGVDKAAAEDVANYSIEGLNILSAKASEKMYKAGSAPYSEDSDYYNRVTLVTSEQKANTKYTLKVNNMVDGSTAKNATTKELTGTFYGGNADKTAPKVTSVTPLSSTLVRVVFNETNKLDPTTALDIANYVIDKDALTVVDAKFMDDDSDEVTIDLTVSEMETSKSYKVSINNIADNFGNAITKATSTYFPGTVIKSAPVINKVYTDGLTTVVVEFSEILTNTAKEATNYSLDNSVGAPTKAIFGDNKKTVKLTFPELTANKTYKLTVNGVENYSAYAVNSATKSFVATRTSADFTKPTVSGVSFSNKGMLRIDFSEAIMSSTGSVTVSDSVSSSRVLTIVDVLDDNTALFNASAIGTSEVVIIKTVSIYDIAGNIAEYTANEDSFTTDSEAYVQADDAVEIVGISQDTVKKIRVYFNDAVKVKSLPGVTGLASAEVDEDDSSVVIFTFTNALAKDAALVFEVDTTITDLIGRDTKDYVVAAVTSDVIKYTTVIKDEEPSLIVEVIATDKRTIEITYDEELSFAGSYSIKQGTTTVGISSVDLDEDVVTITTSADLDSTKYYVLKQGTPSKDLSNNSTKVVTDGFEFIGSDANLTVSTLAGVAVINGYTVQVKNTSNLKDGNYKVNAISANITSASVNLLANADTVTLASATVKTQDLTVAKIAPFVKGVSYSITNPYTNSVVTFTGIVERDVLTQATAASITGTTVSYATYNVKLNGLSLASSTYEVLVGEVGGSQITTSGSPTVVNDAISFTVTGTTAATMTLVSGDSIRITVLDENGNPVRTSDGFMLKAQ